MVLRSRGRKNGIDRFREGHGMGFRGSRIKNPDFIQSPCPDKEPHKFMIDSISLDFHGLIMLHHGFPGSAVAVSSKRHFEDFPVQQIPGFVTYVKAAVMMLNLVIDILHAGKEDDRLLQRIRSRDHPVFRGVETR